MTRVFAIALAGLTSLPIAAFAQTDYDQQVQDFLRSSGETILETQGLYPTDEVYTGSLDADSDEDYWVTVQGGQEYAFLGVCDIDCSDIDLYVYDEKGGEVGSDATADDVPVVHVSPRTRTSYRVRVDMFDCDVEPCFYAVGLYQEGGSAGNSGDYQGQADRYLQDAYDALLADDTYRFEHSLYGDLNSSGDETFQIQMRSGRSYAVLGACDDDCTDMDLFLEDRNGKEIASDVETDSFPLMTITAPYSGTFDVRVRMYECTAEPCFFSVGVYGR